MASQSSERLSFFSPEKEKGRFDSLDSREQEIELERSLFMIQIAEECGVELNARDIALILGYEDEGFISKISHVIKSKLPLLQGPTERFQKVVEHIQERANFENEEFDIAKEFSRWIGEFEPSELEKAKLISKTAGHVMGETPMISVPRRDGSTGIFELGKLLNLPKECQNKLPGSIKEHLEARRRFWAMHGITSGPELQDFLEKNFSRERVIFSQHEPVEFEWLKEMYPDDYSFLGSLQDRGATIHLVMCRTSPDSVLGAVRHIATESQHEFVSTWLPDLLREGIEPVVTRRDIQRLEERYARRQRAVGSIKSSKFLKRLIERKFGEEMAQKTNFAESIEKIVSFAPLSLNIEVGGIDLSPKVRRRVEEINQKLMRGIGNEYAQRKVLFDDADEISGEAQNIIKAMAVVGPAAHVLEHFFHLPGIAKFLAASVDDIMSEWAEISALRGAGITWQEIRKRFTVLAPAIPVAFVLAGIVEPARTMFNERVAGSLFSLAAVFLSAVTCVLSAKMFAEKYVELAREGKLREFYPIVERAEQLEEIRRAIERLGGSVAPEEIWSSIEETLRKFVGNDEEEIEEIRKLFLRFSQSKGMKEILEGLRQPSCLEYYLKGIREAMGINPARFGIAAGAFTSPFFGFLFGPVFLSQPFLYALAGSYESAAGVGSIIGYKKIFPLLWKMYVRGRIKESKERQSSSSLSFLRALFSGASRS